MLINDIAPRHWAWVDRMGWHAKSTSLERIGLIASEVGEAVAECPLDDKPTSHFGEELADIILRIADFAYDNGLDLDAIKPSADSNIPLKSPAEALGRLMPHLSRAMNACRGDELGEGLAESLAVTVCLVDQIACFHGVDLKSECIKKMDLNEKRGNRGRIK